MEAGVVTTVVGKIWNPEAKRREMIKETHKMLAHAGEIRFYTISVTHMTWLK